MLIKRSVEFIRFDDKVSCDCGRRNGILGSSLEKNISIMEEKFGQSNKKWVSSSILSQLPFITWYIVGKKTPVQTILFSLLHPSLKPQMWAICMKRSISSSDKGLIARSSVGKCHVKINQSQSIRTEKHTYIRRSVALSPRVHQPFPVLLYLSVTGWQAII